MQKHRVPAGDRFSGFWRRATALYYLSYQIYFYIFSFVMCLSILFTSVADISVFCIVGIKK